MSYSRQRVEEVHVPFSYTAKFSNLCNSYVHIFDAKDEKDSEILCESIYPVVFEEVLVIESAS